MRRSIWTMLIIVVVLFVASGMWKVEHGGTFLPTLAQTAPAKPAQAQIKVDPCEFMYKFWLAHYNEVTERNILDYAGRRSSDGVVLAAQENAATAALHARAASDAQAYQICLIRKQLGLPLE